MTEEKFNEITKWQKKTFPKATVYSKLSHLNEELTELSTALITQEPQWRLEFADCFLLLFGAAAAAGMTYEDICSAITEKMMINVKRKWGKPNKEGVVKHIE